MILKAGERLIPFYTVAGLDITSVESAQVDIILFTGERFTAHGSDAIEAVMLLKPSALEGRRLKWKRSAWAFHNLVGHPVMQLLSWAGFQRAAIRLHDATVPTPR